MPESHKLTVGVPFYLSTLYHINDEEGDIVIGEDCWIGAGCILFPKCRIGRGSVVGAGSIVKKDVPPYAVVAGVPAKVIATKFSIEEILEHEILYIPKERLSREKLVNLFYENYQGLNSIGMRGKKGEFQNTLEEIRKEVGMTNYL